MSDPQKTIELVASSFELMRGKLSLDDWSANLVAAANAESAICSRWTSGKPETEVASAAGPNDTLPPGWVNWADHAIRVAKPNDVVLLDDMVQSIDRIDLIEANPAYDPQMLVSVVDWQPANIIIAVHRDRSLGEWTEQERAEFLELSRLVRRSTLLHKDYSRTYMIANTTIDILNSSPRGIVSLGMRGDIQFANSVAEHMLTDGDGISTREGCLCFADKAAQAAMKEFIETVGVLQLKQLEHKNPSSRRNFSAKRPSSGKPYQVLMIGTPISSWSVESSPSDRNIIVYMYDPQMRFVPSEDQLRSYFDLTKAQAKVAAGMYTTNNIVTVAENLGISVNTARTHLRAIYVKMGANNQSDLVSTLTATIKNIEKSMP